MTIALIPPTRDLYDSWAAAVAEFDGVHIDGSGLTAPVVPGPGTLDGLIEKARLLADTTAELPDGAVHNDLLWIVDDREVVGFFSFRHTLNEWLREAGGHIGYSVRLSRRRRGYASAALALGLDRARAMGLEQVLITCDDDNVGSARTIERAGGVLQDVSDQTERGHARLRRYWITL